MYRCYRSIHEHGSPQRDCVVLGWSWLWCRLSRECSNPTWAIPDSVFIATLLDSLNPGFIWRAPLVNPLDSRTGIHKVGQKESRYGLFFFAARIAHVGQQRCSFLLTCTSANSSSASWWCHVMVCSCTSVSVSGVRASKYLWDREYELRG